MEPPPLLCGLHLLHSSMGAGKGVPKNSRKKKKSGGQKSPQPGPSLGVSVLEIGCPSHGLQRKMDIL